MDLIVYKDSSFDYHWFRYYYINSQTNGIYHGLWNSCYFVGYRYHNQHKGFCLRNENWL